MYSEDTLMKIASEGKMVGKKMVGRPRVMLMHRMLDAYEYCF